MVNVSNSTVKNIFENGMIPKLIKKNGPPQCGIYTLGQLSKLYVLIRLEDTNKNRSQERIYYFFSLIPFGDKVLSFLIQKLSLSCLLKVTTDRASSASFLDLYLEFDDSGQLSTKIYDKRDDFNFKIINFPNMCSNIPASPAYGVYISQLIRYARPVAIILIS